MKENQEKEEKQIMKSKIEDYQQNKEERLEGGKEDLIAILKIQIDNFYKKLIK